MSAIQHDDDYEHVHTACYCCWLAGSGGMPPCSWCTSGAGDDEEDEDDQPVVEDPIEAYDRAMKGLC